MSTEPMQITPKTGKCAGPILITRKTVALPEGLWEAVVEYRHVHRLASQAEAVRGLIDAALKAERRKAARRV